MEPLSIPQKLAVINDISGYGRCSLTVALPVISALKVQACPVPTSYFSNHMGFSSFFSKDLSEYLPDYFAQWEKMSLSFDGIYCGYLNTISQTTIVNEFIKYERTAVKKKCTVIIDPVMGDHGVVYKNVTPQFCDAMKTFIAEADIITPNLTEACILTNTHFKDKIKETELIVLSQKLQLLGAKKVVITGILLKNVYGEYELGNFVYENSSSYTLIQRKVCGKNRPGTGDLFASIVSAETVKGADFIPSVEKAVDFIALCIKASEVLNIPVEHGVCFENFIKEL